MKPSHRNPFSRNSSLFATALLLAFSALPAFALVRDWSATAGDTVWATGTNWVGGTAPADSLTTDDARFNQTSYTSLPDYGTRSINKLIFGDGTVTTAPITLSGTALSLGGTITVNANSGAVTIDGTNQIGWGTYAATNNSSSLLTIGAGLKSRGTGGVTTFSFNGTGRISVTGAISNGGGTNDVAIIKSGAGSLSLSGTNTFRGGVQLSGSTAGSQLNLNSTTALGGALSRLTIDSGDNAKLDNTSGVPITIGNNNPQSWDSNFAFVGTNDLNMGTGAVTMGGSRTITPTTSGKTLTIGGVISGSGFSLTKAGAGNLTLTGANAYTGGTSITGGRLILNRAGSPAIKGNVSMTTSSNTARPVLYLLANDQLESTASVSGSISGSNATFTEFALGGRSQTIAGYSASGSISTGSNIIENDVTGGTVGGTGLLTINNSSLVTLGTSTNRVAIRDGGSGTLGLIKDGSGTLSINLYTGGIFATTSYTGGFTLKNGTVQVAGPAFFNNALKLEGGTLSSSDTTARTFVSGNTVSLAGDVTLGNALNNGKLTFPGAATLTDNRILTINSAVEFSGGTGDGGTAKSLTKVGPGTLILGGTNIYTGDTNINAGRLDVVGSLTSNVILAANTTIGGEGSINTGSALTFSAGGNTLAFDPTTPGGLTAPTVNTTGAAILVSSDAAVTATTNYLVLTNSSGFGATVPPAFKAATRGTLVLDNLNTELRFIAGSVQNLAWRGYTGPDQTLWNIDGTANWDNGGSPDKSFNLDTVLFDDNAITTVVQITGSNVSPAGTITFNNSTKNYTLGSSGSYGITTGNLIKTGTGTLTITNSNAYDGGTLLENGTININNADAIGSPAGALTFDSSSASGTPVPTLQLGATIPASSRGIILTTDGFIDTNGYDLTQTGIVSGAGTLTKIGAGILTLGASNSYDGATVIKGGTLSIGADLNLGSAPTSATAGKIEFNGGTLSLSAAFPISANRGIALSGSGKLLNTAAGLAIYTGIINGSGPLTLESNNGTGDRWSFGNTASDYSGNTILSGSGTVVIQADSMGSATTADLTAGAFGTGTVSLNGAGMRSTTGAAKTIGNAITIDADTSFPTLASEKSLTFSGPVTLTGNRTLTANIGATVTTQTLAFSGAIGQNVAGRTLTHAGSGKIHLSGDNSYSGGTYLTGSGVLSIAHSNALGSGSLLLQSTQTSTPTTLAISGGITVTNPITMDSTTGRESISSTGTGNNALNGGITITGAGSNHLAISNNQTSGSLTISGGINGATYAGNVSLRGSLAGPNGFINGAVTIASEFQQNGTTDWVVNCPGSTWTNTRLMGAGGIILGADDALATSAKVLWTAGTGAVDLAGFNQTVAGLDAAAVTGAKVTNTGAADKKLTLNGLAADYTYAGTINDGSTNKVSLEMNSTGRTQTLTGANLYTGATTITGGTLALASTGSIDSSTALTIAAGAELDTTAKTTSQALPATVVIGLNGTAATSGLIDATGKALDVDGATVTFNVSGTLTAPSYVLANYGSISGTAAFASVTPPGGYTVNYGTGSNSTITLDKIAGSAYETWGAAYSLGAGTEGLDLDNDGMSNFEEFAFGLIPNSGSSVNPITSQLSKTSGQFTYQRLATSGLTYTIWTSSDLVTWTPDATANQNVTSGTPNDSVLVTLSALPKPLTATKTFVRVKAE